MGFFAGEECKTYGDYVVTSTGKVYSMVFRNKQTVKKREPPLLLKAESPATHYPYVRINVQGRTRKVYVHQLVATLFIGPRPPGCEVGHKDGTRNNNDVSNLYWITRRQNLMDRARHGTDNAGERNGHSKLTEPEVNLIRDIGRAIPQRKLATMFGVTSSVICNILNRKIWKHLPIRQGGS